MRALIIQLLFLLCSSEVFAWSLDPSQYVEPQRNAFRQHVINLYEEKNYSALEELSQSVLEEQSELADGTWLIHELMLAIRKSTNGIQRPKNYFPRLQAWEKAHPNSSIPQLLKADAYRQLAWKARGTGTIDTTHTEGRSKFKELIEKALNALKNSEDLDHPEYYRILLASAKAAQFPKQQLISIFQVGAKHYPNYTPLYVELVSILSPQWYGTPGEIGKMASWLVQDSKLPHANEMYARIVQEVVPPGENHPWELNDFSWDIAEAGFQSLLLHHPGSQFIQNTYIGAALAARQDERAKHLMALLNVDWNEDQRSVWHQRDTLKKWQEWLVDQAEIPRGGNLLELVKTGTKEEIDQLLKNGASIDQSTVKGVTPLLASISARREDIATLLIMRGADINHAAVTGVTPIIYATTYGMPGLVRFLILKGASVDAIDETKYSALHYAAKKGYWNIVGQLLSQSQKSCSIANNDDRLPIHLAAEYGHKDVIDKFARYPKCSLNAPNKTGWTPLHLAVYNGRVDATRALLSLGANPNVVLTKSKSTPLHVAAQRGELEVLTELLKAKGINLNAHTKSGKTPLETALDKKHFQIAELLRSKEATL